VNEKGGSVFSYSLSASNLSAPTIHNQLQPLTLKKVPPFLKQSQLIETANSSAVAVVKPMALPIAQLPSGKLNLNKGGNGKIKFKKMHWRTSSPVEGSGAK
jgi:hypothetical protein